MNATRRGVARAALAAALGLALGLLIAWVIAPVEYVDTAPRTLRDDYRTAYLALIARAYAVDGNLERARARLVLAVEGDPARTAAAAAQRLSAAGGAPGAVQALAALAADLGAGPSTALSFASPTPSPAVATAALTSPADQATPTAPPGATATLPSPTPLDTATVTPSPTDTPAPTLTPRRLPTRTPTPTPLGAFLFASQQQICDPTLGAPLIQVITQDRSGQEIGGAEVIVEWDAGFDHFFTGLKPELGAGYGDFEMAEGIEYTVHLAESPGAMVGPLAAETCTGAGGQQFPGAWRLIFRQP